MQSLLFVDAASKPLPELLTIRGGEIPQDSEEKTVRRSTSDAESNRRDLVSKVALHLSLFDSWVKVLSGAGKV